MNIKRAILSVSNKSGIIELAQKLHSFGIEILSTDGTAKTLQDAHIPVREISDFTGFPEMMDGRVKTLHPKVHGAILAKRQSNDHKADIQKYAIELIDLVVVNLYPFVETTRNADVSLEIAIENIDIGGPTMLRSAAKNYQNVVVVNDPLDYEEVLRQIEAKGDVNLKTREKLALKAFRHTSSYDCAIDTFLSQRFLQEKRLHLSFERGQKLRYGENSHQEATFYFDSSSQESVARAEILNGKAMSYNNYVDANAALEVVKEFSDRTPAVAVIKHTNPCGLATGKTPAEAAYRAWEGDPVSSFGGVVATNQTIDLDFAHFLKGDNIRHLSYRVQNGEYLAHQTKGKFVEVLIAPHFTQEAVHFLQSKSKMIRLLKTQKSNNRDPKTFRAIKGGILIQDCDQKLMENFHVVTRKQFPESFQALSEFGLIACKHTKSNAIVIVREYSPGYFQVMGMGAGQPNRVDSLRKLAIPKTRENLQREFKAQQKTENFDQWADEQIAKMVLISDAFFPFNDTVREAFACGIRYIIQPGGSIRDEDSIQACDELDIAMAFTGLRHFNH